ncbi:MAG: calcium-binding protein [Alphaproteobacteria bacterium]
MAVIVVDKPLDLLSADYFPGRAPTSTASSSPTRVVVVEPGGDVVTLDGSFTVTAGFPSSGDLEAIAESGPSVGYQATGLDLTVAEFLQFRAAVADGASGFAFVQRMLQGDDSLFGGAGNDRLVGFAGNDSVFGGAGDDDVNGNTGDDFVMGGDGADFVRGGQGQDTVYGEFGDDWHVNGNIGDDLVLGDGGRTPGNDTIFGGQGRDTVFGDTGEFDAPGGNDSILGNLGDDELYGEEGNDTLQGNEGDDFLMGAQGLDSLLGGAGADTLIGGLAAVDAPDVSADVLDGGAGDDVLIGENGADTMTGGPGADRFEFLSGDGGDTILDFTPGEDVIALAADLNGMTLTPQDVYQKIILLAQADGQGNTQLGLGDGNSVDLIGVLPSQLRPEDFTVI